MSIKRFVANKDTTITNAFYENLITRAEIANMGAADVLEIFSIYDQTTGQDSLNPGLFNPVTSGSIERSRVLIQFPIEDIKADRLAGRIPTSGSVQYILKVFNVAHNASIPKDFSVTINPISKSWEEGYGLDMEGYSDSGFVQLTGGYGCSWTYNESGSFWETKGGDIVTGLNYDYIVNFKTGLENIELDITPLVEEWISESIPNNGIMIKLSSSYEDASKLTSYYTKRFSGRNSQYTLNRPCIEARWAPLVTDDRNNFFASSSLLSAEDNTMNLYFYNKVGGSFKNIYGNPIPTVKFFIDSSMTNEISSSLLTINNPLPGVYKAQVCLDTTSSIIYDKWVDPSDETKKYFSSSFDVLQRDNDTSSDTPKYIINITNLKPRYNQQEKARFNIYVREKDWQPNIYSVAYNNIENTSIPNLYYKIFRFNDNYTIVDYSTGSLAYTKASYDENGNYFDLDMTIFEKDYGYGIKLATWDGNYLKEFSDIFKFRID